jgi:aryl-alcohol dehydrogenase-like predicted oxidoreductase
MAALQLRNAPAGQAASLEIKGTIPRHDVLAIELPKLLQKAAGVLFGLTESDAGRALPAPAKYASQAAAAQSAVDEFAAGSIEAALIEMTLKGQTPELAIAFGWVLLQLETFSHLLGTYSAAEDRAFEKRWKGRPDVRVAHRIRAARWLRDLTQTLKAEKLPDWAAEIDCKTWAQVFLKYLVSHPGVTVVVPGTAQVKYVANNLGGAQGRLPDAAMRKRMEQFIDGVKG